MLFKSGGTHFQQAYFKIVEKQVCKKPIPIIEVNIMQIKYGEVTEMLLNFLNEVPHDFLEKEAVVLKNSRWEIHLDYTGNNPEQGINDLKFFVNHKKNLIGNIIKSENPSEILGAARLVAEYFKYRNFTVSVGAGNNILLGLWLRARILWAQVFGM